MKPLAIGMLGLGTVGSGVAKIILQPQGRHPILSMLALKKVAVRTLDKPRDIEIPTGCYTTDPQEVIHHPDIDIVVEVMGRIDPTFQLLMQAIEHGKHIVTANKSLLAAHGAELLNHAASHNVHVAFEAAVAGGIPIIQALTQSLGANRLRAMTGIINGTTNYILTQMSERNWTYQDALIDAQAKGYAEDPPDFDVSGRDAAEKLAILTQIGFGKTVNIQDALDRCTTGIDQTVISDLDIQYAIALGYRIKLLATSEIKGDGSLLFHVGPSLVSIQHPLASVNDVFNAIFIQGDPVDELMFYGRGAGQGPTASAVVADLIQIATRIQPIPDAHSVGLPAFQSQPLASDPISNELYRRYYLRIRVNDGLRGVGGITSLLEKSLINPSVVRKEKDQVGQTEIIVITEQTSYTTILSAVKTIESLPYVLKANVPLPILTKD